MKQKVSLRLFLLGIALGALGGAAVLAASAYGGSSSPCIFSSIGL